MMSQEFDNKYLISIIYIKSNDALKDEIRSFFKKDIPKKSSEISFHVSDKITFIDVYPYRDEIAPILNSKLGFSVFDSKEGFKKNYMFEPVESGYMKELLPTSSQNLTLQFSKPIDNFLVAELMNFDSNKTNGIKFGKGLRMLFVFNKKGLVDRVYTKSFIYN